MNGGNLVQEFMLFVGLLAIAYEFTFYCTLTDFFPYVGKGLTV